ncbi:MAG TPA: XRE family transcriptional regulator [Acidimicrobiia bacterium]|nr:XRE family transcriptional regulator [Acidimicrobiia bacterium]HIL47043.1 XRE family transcriptional regulator [Acidimicrobiia bacterium]
MSEAPIPGPLLRQRRKELKWTLDDLAAHSGVSRSMVSQIERSETNPTFATLWNLTQALNIDFSDLTTPTAEPPKNSIETTSADRTPLIQADENRVSLRILSPPDLSGKTEWYELTFQPNGHLASTPHSTGTIEHLTVLSGQLTIEAGEATQYLDQGTTGRYPADLNHHIRNLGKTTATALLVVLAGGTP